MLLSDRFKRIWETVAEPDALRVLLQAVALAPRLLLHVASIAALAGLFSACVPATRYEEAKSASEVQLAGRTRAETELAVTRAKLDAALAELGQRDRKLIETEQSASESKLESTLLVKQRDEATGLVDQLRGELARVGENLRSYAQQKSDLEKSLQLAQARKLELEQNEAHTVAVARLTGDLSAALSERINRRDLVLDVREGHVVLSGAPQLWFNDDGSVRSAMDDVIVAVSRVLALHPEAALSLGSRAVSEALVAKGVAVERLRSPVVAKTESEAPPQPAVDLSFAAF